MGRSWTAVPTRSRCEPPGPRGRAIDQRRLTGGGAFEMPARLSPEATAHRPGSAAWWGVSQPTLFGCRRLASHQRVYGGFRFAKGACALASGAKRPPPAGAAGDCGAGGHRKGLTAYASRAAASASARGAVSSRNAEAGRCEFRPLRARPRLSPQP